jgi:hypothetical protein
MNDESVKTILREVDNVIKAAAKTEATVMPIVRSLADESERQREAITALIMHVKDLAERVQTLELRVSEIIGKENK